MRRRISSPAMFIIFAASLILCISATYPLNRRNQSVGPSLFDEPYLVREAAEKGIWPGMGTGEVGESNRSFTQRTMKAYTLSDFANPYFQHGDFDFDGICDLAILIIERSTGRKGIAIVPGQLDQVHLIGVGPSVSSEHVWDISGLSVDPVERRERLLVSLRSGRGFAIEWEGSSFGTYVVDGGVEERREPELVLKAREQGFWPEGIRYEILWEKNPAYLRGDFNGDGEFDVAVLVRDTSNREKGIVVIHSTLDTLYTIFDSTPPSGESGIKNPSRILLIPKGKVLRPFPEPEPKDPIELKTDAIWAGWPGAPYSGAWYFTEGRYVWITLSD